MYKNIPYTTNPVSVKTRMLIAQAAKARRGGRDAEMGAIMVFTRVASIICVLQMTVRIGKQNNFVKGFV